MSAPTTQRAKPINKQWAALKAASFDCVGDSGAGGPFAETRGKWHYVHIIPPPGDRVGHEVWLAKLAHDILECDKLLKHARKGSGWANALDQAISDCPRAQAAIAAAEAHANARKEAAKLAKTIGKAKPEARARARL